MNDRRNPKSMSHIGAHFVAAISILAATSIAHAQPARLSDGPASLPPPDPVYEVVDGGTALVFNTATQTVAGLSGVRRIAPPNDMAFVPAGEFRMGSPDGEGYPDEHPGHKVYVDAFYMDSRETTVGQYKKCVAAGGCTAPMTGVGCNWDNPARGDNFPVNCVEWSQADSYCKWAGKRLPTEAEWEKAARGGTDTRYSFGDNEAALGDYAWYWDNSGGKDHLSRYIAARYLHLKKYLNDFGGLTHLVGGRNPNQFGLYDMYGNVWEWVSDWYDENYYKSSPEKNPPGPLNGKERVVRGGDWHHGAESCRSANRSRFPPTMWYDITGFRCASGRQ